jgi:hypothetical protein
LRSAATHVADTERINLNGPGGWAPGVWPR